MDTPQVAPPAPPESVEIERASPTMPALIPQPHGGAILTGGVPGHRGGGGRPPKRLRVRARELLAKVIERLEAKLQDERIGVTGLSEAARTLKAVAGDDDDGDQPGETAILRLTAEQMSELDRREAEERARDAETPDGEVAA